MKKLSLYLLAALAICSFACSSDSSQPSFELSSPFTLKQGETISWKDDAAVKIRFDQVPDDSRCPKDVQCVWAGRAQVNISFTQDGDSQSNSLILGDPAGTNYTDMAQFGAFKVKLLQVNPYPEANKPIEQSAYSVELEVRKN